MSTELTIEDIKKLIEQASPIEFKYLLKLRLERRRGGCGYVYLFWTDAEVIYGDADVITLDKYYADDCTWFEDILIVPKTVPTIVLLKHHDDDPEYSDYNDIYVFDRDGWKSVRVWIPKKH
jgi:hypothetical protein